MVWNKIKEKNPVNQYLQGFLWNRRESNPGPNKQSKSFLHAYFLI